MYFLLLKRFFNIPCSFISGNMSNIPDEEHISDNMSNIPDEEPYFTGIYELKIN